MSMHGISYSFHKRNYLFKASTIDKQINIDTLCTQNHQELYSPGTHTSRGQSVLQ